MARRKSGGRRWRTAAALFVLLFVGWMWREIGGTGSTESASRVVIPRRSTMRAAADSLERAGVIGSTRLFRAFASTTGQTRAIKPGTYLFPRHAGYSEVFDALVNGRGIVHTITVPEGYDIRDIAPLIAKALLVSEDSVREIGRAHV